MEKNINYRKKSQCVICKSKNTTQLYKADANPKKLSFTYEFTPQAKKTFRVVRCNDCTHVFCDPLPNYLYKYYIDVVDSIYLTQENDRKHTAKVLLQEIKKFKKTGRILDIGCATGDFLEVARKFGYDVEGLELSKWSAKIASNKGIEVHRQSIKSFSERNKGRFDIVTLWGVIEHFEKPIDELQYIHKLLKNEGLLIVWTGDVDSITSKVMKRKWWYWLGQHIQYFTRKSLKRLGEATGFREILSKTYPQAVSLSKVENSMGRYRNYAFLLFFFRLVFFIKEIWVIKVPGEIFWIAKKTTNN